MSTLELILISIGLAMDAFAVSICKGLEMKKFNKMHALIIALFFGFFQALMPLIGYFIGSKFEVYITNVDHWIAFFLLFIIGSKMFLDSFKKEDTNISSSEKLNIKQVLLMAVATSIDALAVGVTFAFLKVSIFVSTLYIGVITFTLSFIGVCFGKKIGEKFKTVAQIIGGIVLILMGTKILLEHLGIINF